MRSQRYGVWNSRGKRANTDRRAPRRFRPAVRGSERLESRELLHTGPAAAFLGTVVSPAVHSPATPSVSPQPGKVHSQSVNISGEQIIRTPDANILIPAGLVPGRTYPLAVAFAYNGSPGVPFEVWREQAQENLWIVYASKDYTNAVLHGGVGSSNAVASRVKAQVDALAASLPIDRSRIVFTGMSGGANFADFMNLRYPGYAAGVIINSGEIPAQLFRRTPTPGYVTMPSASAFAGSRRVGVFLCSPSDNQFFGITQANERSMHSLGWDTLFLSFPGGHRNAPAATYRQAIAWMMAQPGWTASP